MKYNFLIIWIKKMKLNQNIVTFVTNIVQFAL